MEVLVTVLLEGIHIFMFVVYGLYLSVYLLVYKHLPGALLCVPTAHIGFYHFFFLYKSCFSHRYAQLHCWTIYYTCKEKSWLYGDKSLGIWINGLSHTYESVCGLQSFN